MAQSLNLLQESPSQTAGPYVHIGCTPNLIGISGLYDQDLGQGPLTQSTKGRRISICGCIFDGSGIALKDALVEIWQADAGGLYNSPGETRGQADTDFIGWGRRATDLRNGLYHFETIKPGRVPFPDGRMQAPHISFWIIARGINLGLHTRLYFRDELQANMEDPILTRIESQTRMETLLAPLIDTDNGTKYRFDIHLQGDLETIFFDI